MIRTQSFRARQPKSLLDECNRESGRIYNQTMADHWRIYRKKGIWLSQYDAMRLNDYRTGETTLHAHSRDAAQEAFYKACKTIKALKQAGNSEARYPRRRKLFRTTVWKNTGIRVKDGVMLLARARGLEPVRILLPLWLLNVQLVEVRLVYNHKAGHYDWHVVTEDGQERPAPPGAKTVAVDLGEIHPAAVCDQKEAVVVSARALRAAHRRRNDALSDLAEKQGRCKKRSRRWSRLQAAKNRVRHQAERRIRDINHKVSRTVVDFACEKQAGTIVIGDVRDIADGIECSREHNRRTSNWTHGQLRQYITYKAARLGMETVLQGEQYTSQTCPCCGHRRKQSGRVYRCLKCNWTGSRDGHVGAPNILSKHLYGELARVRVQKLTYRHPFLTGKRTALDTGQSCYVGDDTSQFAGGSSPLEATGF